ncbi:Isochorismatase-like protein [Peziza echinospora]|nr:Isochorismatase-like protein [Peziza echinospora]
MGTGTGVGMDFICDIQEAFRPAIHEYDAVITTTQKLLQAAKLLSIQTIVTTQNTTRLGPTVSELLPHLPPANASLEDKSLFSMLTPHTLSILTPLLSSSSTTPPVTAVAIAGIEAHVCVLQTVLDLRKRGVQVYVIRDAVSSCNKEEVPVAIERMRGAGAVVTTSESWLYEVMGGADIPEFRDVLKIVKATKESTRDGLQRLCKI